MTATYSSHPLTDSQRSGTMGGLRSGKDMERNRGEEVAAAQELAPQQHGVIGDDVDAAPQECSVDRRADVAPSSRGSGEGTWPTELRTNGEGSAVDVDELDTTVRIGPQDEWTAVLPLSTVDAGLATSDQRFSFGAEALDRLLEKPENRRRVFADLRDEIMALTGIDDATATLVVYSRESEIGKTA